MKKWLIRWIFNNCVAHVEADMLHAFATWRAEMKTLADEITTIKAEMVKLAVYVGPKEPEKKESPPVKMFTSASAFRDTLERETEESAQREF